MFHKKASRAGVQTLDHWLPPTNKSAPVKHEIVYGLIGNGFQMPGQIALRVFEHEVKMRRFIHVVEKREGGGINKNMDGSEQTKQPNDFMFLRLGRRPGGIGILCVHP